MSKTYYKVLNEDGAAIYARGKWPLPADGKPGKWMPTLTGSLVACSNGYHLCDRNTLVEWLGPTLYSVESRRFVKRIDDKILCRQARLLRRITTWNECTARLFAADCAEHVLPLFEKACPEDDRPRKAIEAARKFAMGEITDAAFAAAEAAAEAAARNAALRTFTIVLTAAHAAVLTAAQAAARDAVWTAAGAAVCAATRAAAEAAAFTAVKATTRATARATARIAERKWQTERLFEYLESG